MNKLTTYTSRPQARLQAALVAMGAALLISWGVSFAKEPGDTYVPSLLPPPAAVDQSLFNRRLRSARDDLEAFRVFADNFRTSGDTKALAQLQEPVDDFLKRHVDTLMAQDPEQANVEATRLKAEIMFVTARLFIGLNRREAAQAVIADMKRRFSEYRTMPLELPGARTTLDRAEEMLGQELAKAAAAEKK
ncbi:MAG TPA: hypothetical protein VF795_11045 [Desulfuromonadaceae bacterium]